MFGENLIKITAFVPFSMFYVFLIWFRFVIYCNIHLAGAVFIFQPPIQDFFIIEKIVFAFAQWKSRKITMARLPLILFAFHFHPLNNIYFSFSLQAQCMGLALFFMELFIYTIFAGPMNRTSCKRLTKRTADERYCVVFCLLFVGVVVVVIILLLVWWWFHVFVVEQKNFLILTHIFLSLSLFLWHLPQPWD